MPKREFGGVRITAVDNFQGEENDIILLSLVRSNTKGKVGFLYVANRICVALSRAKKGLFCFGNFTLLRKSSETWKSILQYLEEQNKVGSCLTLCCFNHPDTETKIYTVDDFNKVPQGGCDKPCDVRLECGHVCKLHCHPVDRNHEDYICEQPCSKKCDNGHPCKRLCSEECHRCTLLVQQTMPQCGHNQSILCYIKPEHFMCTAPCTKKCNQGHLCSKLCSQECGPCKTFVQKAHPICGHIQNVYCSQECGQCKVVVEKAHPTCGHMQDVFCSQECGPCKTVVQKAHPICGHIQNVYCSQECGRCKVVVEKAHPTCGHIQKVYCYKNPALCRCKHPCEKRCSTNLDHPHKCEKLCYLPCGDCEVPVLKTLPQCGHEQWVECYCNPLYHICQEPCRRKLDCGHPCTNKCGALCTLKCIVQVEKILHCKHPLVLRCSDSIDDVICQIEIKKIFPNCGHSVTLPCSSPITEAYCQETVQRTLTCGHKTSMKCSKRVEDFKCKTKIKEILKCGHVFEGPCNKKDEQCNVLSVKQFAGCRHKMKLPCYEDLPPQCVEKCDVTLMCGHRCSGNCSECYQGRMHKPCAYQMSLLPCGHPTQEICTTITFPLCQYKCTYSCAHRKACTHNCGQTCNPCRQRCSWSCPHYKCTKMCHEMCNWPRCDHPCRQILECRHPCIGICGEPCPRVCRICKKQKKTFYKWCVSSPSIKTEVRYIQLSCNHIFEVKELDQLLDNQFKGNTTVKLLGCPACNKEIHSSNRYGNLIKKGKEIIQSIRDVMFEPAAVEKQQTIIKKVLSHFVPDHTGDIQYNEVDRLLKQKRKHLPAVFKKPQRYLLAHSLNSAQATILENEIDQYMLLKEYELLYEQYTDLSASLKDLLTFFVKTPPSAQKNQDVSCERQRIFLLWMISDITSISIPQEHSIVIEQLEEKLKDSDQQLTLPTLATHYEKLQAIAQKVGKCFKIGASHMQSSKTAVINGIWKVCPRGHVYCQPRGLSDGKWQCPECLQ